ncbi:MAG TPA: Ig-like domain-containing protein [Hyalangium sp.]|nr:Ig-like domain-containing protein [Hyalangium sp.]
MSWRQRWVAAAFWVTLLPGVAFAQDRWDGSTPSWLPSAGGWQIQSSSDGFTTWRLEVNSGCQFFDHSYTLDIPPAPEHLSDISYSMSNYDVDYNDPQGCQGGPEVDLMSFNGHRLGQLTGATDSWSINTWPLGKSQMVQGPNQIFIDTDATNTGCWCVGVGWIEVRAKVGFKVLSFTPQANDKNRDFHANALDLTVTLSTEYDPATLTSDTFKVEYRDERANWQPVTGSLSQLAPEKFRFLPDADLKDGVRYRVTLKSGAAGLKGQNGETLDSDTVWYFWTVPNLALNDPFDYGSGSLCPPSGSSCPGLEIAAFQTARNAAMVAGKQAVARLYLRWKRHTDVHPDDQVLELEVEAKLEVDGVRQTQTQTMRRPDRYTAADRAAARNTINLYQTPSSRFTYEAEVTPRPQTNATPVKYTQTLSLSSTGRTPRLSFKYYFSRDGAWDAGVPSGDRTEGTNLMTGGAQSITDMFPVLSTTFTSGGELGIGYTYTGADGGICNSRSTAQVPEVNCPVGTGTVRMAEFRCVVSKLESLRGGARMIAGIAPASICPMSGGFQLGNVYMLLTGVGSNNEVIAHEVGHVYGISTANNPDHGHRLPSAGVEGFQVRTRTNRSITESPSAAVSLMHPFIQPTGTQWIHNDDYGTLLGAVTFLPSRVPQASSRTTTTVPYLIVSGFIDLSANSAVLEPAYLQEVPNNPPSSSGSCTVELLDGGGAVLARDFVEPQLELTPSTLPGAAEHGTPPAGLLSGPAFFSVSLPWDTSAQTIRVSCNGSVLAVEQRSDNPPSVDFVGLADGDTLTGMRLLEWQGSDPDGPPGLFYQLQHSSDGGTSWTPLSPLGSQTRLELDTSLLPTGSQHLRILVTDGFDTAYATRAVEVTHTVTVLGILPAQGAVGVPITTTLQAQFGSDIDSSTLNGSTFTLRRGGTQVEGQVEYDAATRQGRFLPSTPLQHSAQYTARLEPTVQDVNGNSLGAPFEWQFTTSSDTAPPAVLKTSPAHGALSVPLNALVQANFSEAMAPSTITASSFQLLEEGGSSVSGRVSYDSINQYAVFRPDAPLQPGTQYTAQLTTHLTDAAGNPLEQAFLWRFTTGMEVSNGVRIVGNYGDQAHDLNGDGLYDNLAVEVDVEVLEAGLYNLNARLIDRNDALIQWQTTGQLFLNQGIHRLRLVYDSAPIRGNGVDGPYVLDSVHFYDVWNPAIAAEEFRAYQTFPYSVDSFYSVLVFGGLPDQLLETGTTREDSFNLRDFTSHVSLPVSSVSYRILVNTDPRVGVSIDANANVDIAPAAGLEAESDVTIEARDTLGNRVTNTFHISVQRPRPTVLLAPAEVTMATHESRSIEVTIQDQFGRVVTTPVEVLFSTTLGTVAPERVSTDTGRAGTILSLGAQGGLGFLTIRAGTASALVRILALVAPEAVSIAGPASGVTGVTYQFTATVSPGTVNLPITYHWRATGQPDVTHPDVASATDSVSFSWSAEGPQTVTVEARNPAGRVSGTHSITIQGTSCRDPGTPTLVLEGASELTLECGVEPWVDPGARAWDACGPVEVHRYNSGSDPYGPGPNVRAEGTYFVQYLAWNSHGHTVSAIRTVHVDDRTAPTLRLAGAAQMTHTCGSPWVDPGVEATDACYGNVAPLVRQSGYVNGWAEGTYTVQYELTDSGGNQAPPVTRTVEVVDCPW